MTWDRKRCEECGKIRFLTEFLRQGGRANYTELIRCKFCGLKKSESKNHRPMSPEQLARIREGREQIKAQAKAARAEVVRNAIEYCQLQAKDQLEDRDGIAERMAILREAKRRNGGFISQVELDVLLPSEHGEANPRCNLKQA